MCGYHLSSGFLVQFPFNLTLAHPKQAVLLGIQNNFGYLHFLYVWHIVLKYFLHGPTSFKDLITFN